jgi:hypothetical protein
MSAGSRSIAAARQRRAGENPPISQQKPQVPPPSRFTSQQFLAQQGQGQKPVYQQQQQPVYQQQQQQPVYQQQQQQQPQTTLPTGGPTQAPTKIGNGPGMLSVSDAFALVTLRLGKLETLVNKWQNEGFQSAYDESSIVQAVLARIDNRQQQQQQIPNPAFSQDIQTIYKEIHDIKLAQHQTQQQQQQQQQQPLQEEDDRVAVLEEELKVTKDLLLHLQSYVMETNQKLVSLVFDPQQVMMSMMMSQNNETEMDDNPIVLSNELSVDLSHEIREIGEEVIQESSLKEFIQNEFSQQEQQEEEQQPEEQQPEVFV